MKSGVISVVVAYSPAPREVVEIQLQMPANSTLQDALAASDIKARFPEMQLDASHVGIWGRKAPLTRTLHDQDRIEIWRSLKVDPKVARRDRFNKQGSRSAGLFSRRREGAKSGY